MNISDKYSVNNYDRYPVSIETGDGVWVWDIEGESYIDMLSAYSAVNVGHCHPRIVRAIRKQAEKITVISGNFYNREHARLCQRLDLLCKKDRVLFSSGGAEAVETAIKISRKWGYLNKEGIIDNEAEIVTCVDAFHGRTTTIISSSTVKQYKNGFGPFTLGFNKIIEFGNAKALSRAINKNTVAFFVEPIQGEGGINIPPPGYLKEVEKICKDNDVLLVLDEIQTGFGRTGYDFAYQYEDVNPDILIIGKSLGGGLPISAILADDHIMDVIGPGDHGSTFGGNPLVCAVALESIGILEDEKLSEKAKESGKYLMSRLASIDSPLIKEVRGRGLFIGVELINKDSQFVHNFCADLVHHRVLSTSARNGVVRFTPPLVISMEEIDWAMERIEKVFKKWS